MDSVNLDIPCFVDLALPIHCEAILDDECASLRDSIHDSILTRCRTAFVIATDDMLKSRLRTWHVAGMFQYRRSDVHLRCIKAIAPRSATRACLLNGMQACAASMATMP